MSKKKFLITISLVIFALVLSACGNEDSNNTSSNNNNENTNTEQDNNNEGNTNTAEATGQSEYEKDLAEADEVAKQVLEAFMTVDYHKLYDLGSDSLKKQMEEDIEESSYVVDDFNPENSPKVEHGVSLHDDFYSFDRYDTLYDEENNIFWYRIETIDPGTYDHEDNNELLDPKLVVTDDVDLMKDLYMTSNYFGVKKSGDEWKVSEITGFLESQTLISESEADTAKESKYTIHERPRGDKISEVYGDDSDIGF